MIKNKKEKSSARQLYKGEDKMANIVLKKEKMEYCDEDGEKYIPFLPNRNFNITLNDADFSVKLLNTLTTMNVNDLPPSVSFSEVPTVTVSGSHNLEEEIKKIWSRLNRTISFVHNCKNCGAKLEIDENKPVFCCKYCGSTYLLGAVQPNSRY